MAKPAARLGDPTSCPIPGHGKNPIASGSPDVLLDGLPAARQTDTSTCGSALISGLSSTVFINGLPAATVASTGTHGNVVIGGSSTVIIGDSHSAAAFTPPSPLAITPDWISFQLPKPEIYNGLACIAHFDDGTSQTGAFDSNNQVRFKTSGKTCQRLELGAQDAAEEPSITDTLLNKILR